MPKFFNVVFRAGMTRSGRWNVFHSLLVRNKSSLKLREENENCVSSIYESLVYSRMVYNLLNMVHLPLDNTFADFGINSGTDFMFVAIDMSAIDVTVANINRIFNSLRYFAGWWLNEKNKSRNQLNSRISNLHNRMNWCKLDLTVKLEKSIKGQMNHIATIQNY